MLFAVPISPHIYHVQQIDASVGEAGVLMLRRVRVERRIGGVRKASDKVLYDLTISAKRPISLQPEMSRAEPLTTLNFLLQPREGSVHSLAIVWHHADTEEAKKAVRSVLAMLRLTTFRPEHPLVNTKFVQRSVAKGRKRDLGDLMQQLL